MSWYNRRVIEEFGKKIILSGSLYAGFLVQAMGEEGTTEKLLNSEAKIYLCE